MEADLDRLTREGALTRVEHSEWATPIVVVPKKDSNSVRICADYKVTLNPLLVVDQYPVPRVEDLFASLAGGQNFSKIDLANAYLQMEVDPESRKYLTINTHKGLFTYNRLPFGIASAPALFQRAMEQILQGLKGTQCYLDDILVTGKTEEEHLQNLDSVLQRLSDYGLRVKRNKCEFFKESLEYLGHIINKDGLHTSPKKVEAVVNAPPPENTSQLRSFLGMINYYGKFLPNLSTTLYPLNRLLTKTNEKKWTWSSDCQESFIRAKELIASTQVLTHYDLSLPVVLAADASAYGIGAVISHIMPSGEERPIAFASRSLTSAEKNYAQVEREALSLIYGVKRFHQYLYGRHFTLVTDHKPLTSLFGPQTGIPPLAAARLQRWALYLASHNYTIVYKSTLNHANADGLSRLPLHVDSKNKVDKIDLFYLSEFDNVPIDCVNIRNETRRDKLLSTVLEYTLHGWPSNKSYPRDSEYSPYFLRKNELSVLQGCLMWGSRIVVPEKFRKDILEELHCSHLGVVKMKSISRSYMWWPRLNEDIVSLCRNCDCCQKISNMPTSAPLHPWLWPKKSWQRIHVDFAGPFKGKMYFVVVDAHSKWPEVTIMNSTTTSATIDVLRNLFSHYGICEQLVSDNGPQFVSEEFKAYLKSNGVKHITSSPYHPSTNGLAERFVQTLKQALRAATDSVSLPQKLARFLMNYRNAIHSTTQESPAKLFLGRALRTQLDLLKPDIRNTVENNQVKQELDGQERVFTVGEKVWARDYRVSGDKWTLALVKSQLGDVHYSVEVDGIIWKRHVEQLRKAADRMFVSQNLPIPDIIVPENVQPGSVSLDEKSYDKPIVDSENVSIESEPVKEQNKCSDDKANQMSTDQPKMRYSLRNNVKAPERLISEM